MAGLAQFYTATVSERLSSRFPEIAFAYRQLLGLQTGAYRAHEDWRKGARTSEVVRAAMIECRTRGTREYAAFREALDKYRGLLTE
jgi:tryptophan 2,3-dioxygenase